MSKTSYVGLPNSELYVVSSNNSWRMFATLGQAQRWFTLQHNQGYQVTLQRYQAADIIAKTK